MKDWPKTYKAKIGLQEDRELLNGHKCFSGSQKLFTITLPVQDNYTHKNNNNNNKSNNNTTTMTTKTTNSYW